MVEHKKWIIQRRVIMKTKWFVVLLIDDAFGYRHEFIQMVERAKLIQDIED